MSNSGDGERFEEALALLNSLARTSSQGDFIFRGEARAGNRYIASSLYRYVEHQYPGVRFDFIDISQVQNEMLGTARRFTSETNEHEILATLRHNGGVVNLVDFTTDYNIALFFACDGSPIDDKEDGRLIIMNKDTLETFVPKVPANRVVAQKSIFVVPSDGRGVISDSEVECILKIPAYLKPVILQHLHRSHDIRLETIYNDLLGFISLKDRFTSPFAELIAGDQASMDGDYDVALQRFSNVVGVPIYDVLARFHRGQLYIRLGRYSEAVDDLGIFIEAGGGLPVGRLTVAYWERGTAFLHMGDLERALQDLQHAKNLIHEGFENFTTLVDVKLAMVFLARADWEQARVLLQSALEDGYREGFGFREDFGAVTDFNLKYDVVIPDDLAAMLEPSICEGSSD